MHFLMLEWHKPLGKGPGQKDWWLSSQQALLVLSRSTTWEVLIHIDPHGSIHNLSSRMAFSTRGAKRALNWWKAASFLACCFSWSLNHFANSLSSTSIFSPRDWKAILAYSGKEEALPARFPTTNWQKSVKIPFLPVTQFKDVFTCLSARLGAWDAKSCWRAARHKRDGGGRQGAAASRDRGWDKSSLKEDSFYKKIQPTWWTWTVLKERALWQLWYGGSGNMTIKKVN